MSARQSKVARSSSPDTPIRPSSTPSESEGVRIFYMYICIWEEEEGVEGEGKSKQASLSHTLLFSILFCFPPDEDVMYGFLDVGWMHWLRRSTMRLHAWGILINSRFSKKKTTPAFNPSFPWSRGGVGVDLRLGRRRGRLWI